MSPHEFSPTALNGSIGYFFILILMILIAMTVFCIQYTHQLGVVLALPFGFLFCSMLVIYYRRRQKHRFERAIIHLCKCMNATENVRGINFRLSYLNTEQQVSSHPTYTIEFDDRYNLLHHFSSHQNSSSPIPPAYTSITLSSSPPPMYDLTKPSNTYQPNEKQ
ncbi:uncharacterized protein B0P05DRAFT_555427 [Gilbertella persicaria]|uniref:uncharacterized protein n=1 Tax=Gilbertella persicaria TaxID=101096 RepID=UPI0022206217|nr:uncharacterized protein B0P05DRAFT_555427 [Gilbertella persicaria]KAI8063722.1 hypothetical protein B0P05DRAFT_555427 [Gilbertella persicaria]